MDGDQVKLNYTAHLVQDGKVGKLFDSNDQLRVTVGNDKKLVQGLHSGIQGMQKRGKRVLVIPPNLAFGSSGSGSVPAKSYVVYQVDLAAVKKKLEDEDSVTISDVDEEENEPVS